MLPLKTLFGLVKTGISGEKHSFWLFTWALAFKFVMSNCSSVGFYETIQIWFKYYDILTFTILLRFLVPSFSARLQFGSLTFKLNLRCLLFFFCLVCILYFLRKLAKNSWSSKSLILMSCFPSLLSSDSCSFGRINFS